MATTEVTNPPTSSATRWIAVAAVALAAGLLVAAVAYWLPGNGRAATTPPTASTRAGLVTVKVHIPGGATRTWQLLAADTTPSIEHGLMGVTDPSLGGYHGMLFEFARPEPTTVRFWMRDTPLPLSLAFFGGDGAMQRRTLDMAPCGDGVCPTYSAAAPFVYALEVPQGRLGSLGLVPGSRIEVLPQPPASVGNIRTQPAR